MNEIAEALPQNENTQIFDSKNQTHHSIQNEPDNIDADVHEWHAYIFHL